MGVEKLEVGTTGRGIRGVYFLNGRYCSMIPFAHICI